MTQNSDRPANARRRGQGRPFPKGVSGNPGGRPRNEDSLAAQLREVLAEVDEETGKTTGRLLAEKYVELGLGGNVMAITAIADRVDGKPAQSVTLKGDRAEPLHVRHSARLEVAPKPELPAPEQDRDVAEGQT